MVAQLPDGFTMRPPTLEDIPEVALYVDAQSPTGATRLYERAGMRVVQEHIHFEKELRPGYGLSEPSMTA